MDDRRARHSLLDVLQQLGTDVKDALVLCLQQHNSIKVARLVCRSMRDAVDSSVRSLRLTVGYTDMELWRQGTRLPLKRWVRCSDVHLILDASLSDPAASTLLSLPFAALPLQARQRITALTLDWEPAYERNAAGAALSTILHRLPSLRRVALCGKPPSGSLQRQLELDALASLPSLQELGMPCGRALAGIHQLTGLRRLEIYDSDALLPTSVASGLRHLPHLTHISMQLRDAPEELRLLLSHLPPSVTDLELPACGMLNGCDVRIRLRGGHITAIEAGMATSPRALPDEMPLHQLACFLAEALLPCSGGALGPRLERLSLGCVRVTDEQDISCLRAESDVVFTDGGQAGRPGPEPAPRRFGPLLDLMRRCEEVEVHELMLGPAAAALMAPPPQPAAAALGFLAVFARRLYLQCGGGDGGGGEVYLTVSLARQPQPPPAPHVAAGELGKVDKERREEREPRTQLHRGVHLELETILMRIKGTGAGSQGGGPAAAEAAEGEGARLAGADAGAGGGGEAADAAAGGAGGQQPGAVLPLLLLRGAFLAHAARLQAGDGAGGMPGWVRRVSSLAAEAAGAAADAPRGGGSGGGESASPPVVGFLRLPDAWMGAAALLQCRTEADLPAVEAAARRLAEAAQAEAEAAGASDGAGDVMAAVECPAPAELIEATPMVEGPFPPGFSMDARAVVASSVCQATQSFLNGEVPGPAESWCVMKRLTWVLLQWSHILAVLPQVEYL